MKGNNMNSFLGKDGMNISKEAIEKAKKGDNSALLSSLAPEDKAKIENLLKDKEALQNVLSSPEAQAILKMFGGKNG